MGVSTKCHIVSYVRYNTLLIIKGNVTWLWPISGACHSVTSY